MILIHILYKIGVNMGYRVYVKERGHKKAERYDRGIHSKKRAVFLAKEARAFSAEQKRKYHKSPFTQIKIVKVKKTYHNSFLGF